MTVPSGTQQTYGSAGIREDLVDVIYDISPIETPFLTGVARVSATNTNHEWQTDALAQASDANAHVEGDDSTADAHIATVRLGNHTQIGKKVAQVSGTQRQVDTAGRGDELTYQMVKRAKELRRDMESSLLANKAKVAGDASTARVLAGIGAWQATNTDRGTGGTDPTGDGTDAAGDATGGNLRALSEDQVKKVIRLCWDQGGNPETIMVDSFNKQAASLFQGGNTRFADIDRSKELTAAIDIYISDFGDFRIVPNRFQRARDCHVLEMNKWSVAFVPGRNFKTTDLAKTGDSDKREVLSEYTLEARNEKASGIVADLTSS